MKKLIKRLILCAVLMLSCIGLVACGSKTDTGKTDKYIVTFFDADQKTVLKTEEVEKGGKATEWTPENKENATFEGWYATPDYVFAFSFDTTIEKDTSVFSMWNSLAKDERVWIIAGNLQGTAVKDNNWGEDGRLHPEKYSFEAVEGKTNTFTLTVDLYENDVFQFGVFRYDEKDGGVYERVWVNQKGYGLLVSPEPNFVDKGNYLASEVNKHDIGVAVSGTYKFTMQTDLKNDNIGKIEWEKIADAPALKSLFTPTIYGTFNGYVKGAQIAPEYVMKQADLTGMKWSLTASMNQGDVMIVLPFNNYNAQVTGGTLTKDSAAVRNPAGYEIMFVETAKYDIFLNIAEGEKEGEYVYSVKVSKAGDYELGAGVKADKYTVSYRNETEGTNYTVYLKNGARYPLFTNPVLPQNETLMGWHFVGAGENGENMGIPEESTYGTDGGKQNGIIGYGVTKEGERDTRVFWLKGTGGTTANGESLSWNSGEEVYMEQTGDHEYTVTLELTGKQKEMLICANYLDKKTGTYLRNGSIVDYDKLDFIDLESYSNIRFSKNGTYKLVLNSLTMKITVTRVNAEA